MSRTDRVTITVVAPGPLATVQDRGRPGFAALGVGRAGAADLAAAARAHRLVGNQPAAALLEAVLGGLTLRTDRDELVAAAGTSAGIVVDGRQQPSGRALRWPAGSTLTVEAPRTGLRTYLAVRGGLAVAPVLGSRSTDTLGGIGPPALAAGHTLEVAQETAGPPVRDDVPEPLASGPLVLDVTPGPRADWFDVETLLQRTWEIGTDLDRVGVRLVGEPLTRRRDGELPSEGIVRGAVQVPPAGLPVVFGADHPTTGGYPVVAVLTAAASDRLAQGRPGTVVRFRVWGSTRAVGGRLR